MNNPIPTLSDGQSDALRKNLMALLAAQAGRYTQGASGSLPKETMDELLVSALYTLSVDPTRPESFAPLVGQNIFACFFQAQTRLLQKRDAALALASSLCLRMDDLGWRRSANDAFLPAEWFEAVRRGFLCASCSRRHRLSALHARFRIADGRGLRAPLPAKAGAGRRAADLFSHSPRAGASGRRKHPLARAGLQPADPGAGKRHGAHAARQDPPRRLHVSDDDRAALLVMLCGRTEGELARLFDRAAIHLAQTLLPNRADARILCQTLGKQLAPHRF